MAISRPKKKDPEELLQNYTLREIITLLCLRNQDSLSAQVSASCINKFLNQLHRVLFNFVYQGDLDIKVFFRNIYNDLKKEDYLNPFITEAERVNFLSSLDTKTIDIIGLNTKPDLNNETFENFCRIVFISRKKKEFADYYDQRTESLINETQKIFDKEINNKEVYEYLGNLYEKYRQQEKDLNQIILNEDESNFIARYFKKNIKEIHPSFQDKAKSSFKEA